MNVRRWTAALAIFAMLAGGVSLASILIFSDHSQPAAQQPAAPRTTLAPPPPSVPTPQEFSIEVLVTEQNCPPGGACVYKYTIEPKYVGLHPLPEKEFTVDYEVTGGHQPQPGKFTVQGAQARIMKDVTLEGPPGAQLQAAVTRRRATRLPSPAHLRCRCDFIARRAQWGDTQAGGRRRVPRVQAHLAAPVLEGPRVRCGRRQTSS